MRLKIILANFRYIGYSEQREDVGEYDEFGVVMGRICAKFWE